MYQVNFAIRLPFFPKVIEETGYENSVSTTYGTRVNETTALHSECQMSYIMFNLLPNNYLRIQMLPSLGFEKSELISKVAQINPGPNGYGSAHISGTRRAGFVGLNTRAYVVPDILFIEIFGRYRWLSQYSDIKREQRNYQPLNLKYLKGKRGYVSGSIGIQLAIWCRKGENNNQAI